MKFSTLDNQWVPSVSVSQMREIDRMVTERSRFALPEMMDMAGSNLAEFLVHQWPRGVRIGPIVVLAGKGHNGGGGICTSIHLLQQGIDTHLCLSAPEELLHPLTAWQLKRFRKLGGKEISADGLEQLAPFLVVDAMIGYNLAGTPKGVVAELVRWANNQDIPIVSLDVPTGLNADSGETSDICIRAEKTVTLALPKDGLGGHGTGELWLSDIGIGPDVYQEIGIDFTPPFAGARLIRLKHCPTCSPHLPGIPV